MKPKSKKLCAFLTAITMLSSALPYVSLPAAALEDAAYTITARSAGTVNQPTIKKVNGTVTNNVSDNNYTVWSTVVNSYLSENTDDTLTRVEYLPGQGVITEVFTKKYKRLSSTVLTAELPLFGGFYSGTEYNFLVFGSNNPDESDAEEIMRIVRYSKDWIRLDACSVYGANTHIPFDAGSLRMEEANGQLYIHTCHEMYMTPDGYHHQANMTYAVNIADMSMTQSFSGILNVWQAGYVSHSFNQFIKADDQYLFRVDHGDAHPRSLALIRSDLDGRITSVDYVDAYEIGGETGDNRTGVSAGGFELSDDNCLIAFNSVDMDAGTYNAGGQRNVFLTVVDKALSFRKSIQLTKYTSDSGITPCTPQLVKVGQNDFLMMWEEYNKDTRATSVRLITFDGDGNPTSEIQTADLRLSDCQPIRTSDGAVRWYVTNGSNVTFYTIDPFDLEHSLTRLGLGDLNNDGSVDASDAAELLAEAVLLGAGSGGTFSPEQNAAADLNGDGKMDASDAAVILVYAAEVGAGNDLEIEDLT